MILDDTYPVLSQRESPARPSEWRITAVSTLLVAAWFGLVAGLIEGVGFLVLQRLGQLMYVANGILWIAPLFDLTVFVALGSALALLFRIPLPRRIATTVVISSFVFLTVSDWLILALNGRIQQYAIVLLAIGLTLQLTRVLRRHETAALRFWRRSLPWVGGLTLVALIGVQGVEWGQERMMVASLPPAPAGAPNVLVILVDTLRADHLSAYGYSRPTSPHIDQLAQQGVLFENAFSASDFTLPSHASILTGRYPHEHGAEWLTPKALVSSPYPTLAEVLRSHGYRTAAFSANVFWFTREEGFGRGFIHFEDFYQSLPDMAISTVYGRVFQQLVLPRLGYEDIPARKRAADIDNSFLRWLDANQGPPFFAFLNYMDTHDPYLPPEPYRHRFSKMKNPGGIINEFVGRDHPMLNAQQLQGEIDAYDGGIAYADEDIGRMLQELRQRGILENTIVIFTSDHGEELGEHGFYGHGKSLYREEIQVPLIVWWPGHVPAGVRVAQPVTNTALPATIASLVGVNDGMTFPGPSLAQAWETTATPRTWPDPLSEVDEMAWVCDSCPVHYGSIKSLISARWHFIEREGSGTAVDELYDLTNDRSELQNLANRPDLQGTVAAFRAELRKASPSESGVTRAIAEPRASQ